MGNCLELRKGRFSNHTFIRSYGHQEYTCTDKDRQWSSNSKKMKQLFAYYNIKHVTGIPYNPTGQAVIEISNRTIKDMLNKQSGVENAPRNRLYNTLLTLNFLNANEKGTTATERH